MDTQLGAGAAGVVAAVAAVAVIAGAAGCCTTPAAAARPAGAGVGVGPSRISTPAPALSALSALPAEASESRPLRLAAEAKPSSSESPPPSTAGSDSSKGSLEDKLSDIRDHLRVQGEDYTDFPTQLQTNDRARAALSMKPTALMEASAWAGASSSVDCGAERVEIWVSTIKGVSSDAPGKFREEGVTLPTHLKESFKLKTNDRKLLIGALMHLRKQLLEELDQVYMYEQILKVTGRSVGVSASHTKVQYGEFMLKADLNEGSAEYVSRLQWLQPHWMSGVPGRGIWIGKSAKGPDASWCWLNCMWLLMPKSTSRSSFHAMNKGASNERRIAAGGSQEHLRSIVTSVAGCRNRRRRRRIMLRVPLS